MSVPEISPQELHALQAQGRRVELIDVRTRAEYDEAHVPSARNLPLPDLAPAAVRGGRTAAPGQPVYVICQSGGRGRQACEKLRAGGVVNVTGGTRAWVASGLPVVRGRRAVSLERQVRIITGALVVLGAGLGTFVDPAFVGLAAFIGAGLVFSGATDICGLRPILARMPWNRNGAAAGEACGAEGVVRNS